MMINRRTFSRRVATTLKMILVLVVSSSIVTGAEPAAPAPGAAPARLTTETVLDAELTLPPGGMRLSELAKLVKAQLGVHLACYVKGGERLVRPKPGKQKVRDLLAAISASMPLTTEVAAIGDRVFLCVWRKPDVRMLAQMMKLARSDDVLERCTAARWLEPVGGRDALVQLLKMLADPDARVRHFAAAAVVDGWVDAAQYRHYSTSSLAPCVAPEGTGAAVARAVEAATWPEARRNMLHIACALRDPKVLPFLKKQLETAEGNGADRDAHAIYWTCATIARIGGPEAEAVLLAVLDRSTPRDAQWIMGSLGAMGTDGAIARLRKEVDVVVKKGGGGNIDSIAGALASSENPAAALELIRILNAPGIKGREVFSVLRALVKFDTPEAQAACLAKFKATTDLARRQWMTTFVVNVAAVREELFVELAKGGEPARSAALALASTYDPRLVPAFVEITNAELATARDDRAQQLMARWKAIQTLGRIGGPDALKALLAIVNGAGKHRVTAVSALGNVSSPEARKALRGALQSSQGFVRRSAAEALAVRPDPTDLDLLLATVRKERPEAGPDIAVWAIWNAVARIGGERAVKELLAEIAKGNAAAASCLIASPDPHCVQAVCDALAGDDAKARGLLLAGFDKRAVAPLSAYYAVSAILAELPQADEKLKLKQMALLGWTRDPRGTDILGKLLVDPNEPVAVRFGAMRGLSYRGYTIRTTTDPAAVEPMRHAYEKDAAELVKANAKIHLVRWGVIPAPKPPTRRPPRKPRPPREPEPETPPDEREFPPPPAPDAG